VLKKFLNSFIGSGNESQPLPSTTTLPNKTQRDVDIEFATSIVKMYWTNNESATEGMPGKKLDEALILKREADLINDCIKIIDSENALMENRKYLSTSVLSCAELQVLVLTPETDTSNLMSLSGISGLLKPHILEIVSKNKKLREYFHSANEEVDYSYAWSNILYQYRFSASDMNIFSALRVLFDDTNKNKDKDWFKPFFGAMCIYSEAKYREEIGLPNMLGERNTNIISLSYSTFLNLVMNGERYPDLAWRDAYPNLEFPNF